MRRKIVYIIIAPLNDIAVAASDLFIAHQPILKIVEILRPAIRNIVGHQAQIAVVIVGIANGVDLVLIADAAGAAQIVVGIGDVIAVAVVGAGQPAVGIIGISVADQRPAANIDAADQIKHAIGEGIVGAGSTGDGRQQVAAIDIVRRRVSF